MSREEGGRGNDGKRNKRVKQFLISAAGSANTEEQTTANVWDSSLGSLSGAQGFKGN